MNYKPEWRWLGRNLANYKQQHAETARKKGVFERLYTARTLTEARNIVFGTKQKRCEAFRTIGSNKR